MDQEVSFSSLPNANYSLAGLRKYIRHCAQIHFLMGSNRRVGLIGEEKKKERQEEKTTFFGPNPCCQGKKVSKNTLSEPSTIETIKSNIRCYSGFQAFHFSLNFAN